MSPDEYQNTRYHECLLEKISDDFKIKPQKQRELDIPKEAITARLMISYEEEEKTYRYNEGWIDYWSLRLVVGGEQDRLIERVYSDFQKNKQKCI